MPSIRDEAADRLTHRRRTLRWSIFFAATTLVAYWCLAILHPFANVIGWAAVLAIVCYPVHQRLVRQTGQVALSALITSLITVLAFLVPVVMIGAIAVKEFVALGHWWQDVVRTGRQPFEPAVTGLAWLGGHVGLEQTAVAGWIQQDLAAWEQSAGQYTITIASGLLDAVMSSVLVVCAMFLLLCEGDRIVDTISDLLPFEPPRTERLLLRVRDVVQASVYGVVVIALVQGALCGPMFWLLGVPSAALWGMIAVFASVLPVVGAFAVWGPVALYLVAAGKWPQAALLTIWGTLVVSSIDNVLRPRLVAGRVGLSELAMFFALLGGFNVFGGLGVVLGPVAFAAAAAIVQTLRERESGAPAIATTTTVAGRSPEAGEDSDGAPAMRSQGVM
jgi:predicted PurR-regulated permease PerM